MAGMRFLRLIPAVMMVGLLAAGSWGNDKNAEPKFKTAEAKHFTRAEGVELTPAFDDYFYAELRNELLKAKLAKEVISEGEAVDDADAPKSIVIKGTITEYKKGNQVKAALIGFGAGMRSLKMEGDVYRRSDNQLLGKLDVHVKIQPNWDEKMMAKFAAQQIVKEMKKELKAE